MNDIQLTHAQIKELRQAFAEARDQVHKLTTNTETTVNSTRGGSWLGTALNAATNLFSGRIAPYEQAINRRITAMEEAVFSGQNLVNAAEEESGQDLSVVDPASMGGGGMQFSRL
ncbi:hypothetical protein BAY61_22450 [Prauserella marina]|uniref:Uncharacterized protein n=1 Tax=Prauserella marina TaxID=530584 RepID=A0A222VUC1_9PSEU|nr:hypothetical protein [Prauserella marina]ASR37301.1 hypothetical protein BAY61_22450 [Prauserella marina]PWV74847.1 hypothetical protein DES30_107245 [Prauserella marina]SDD39168.1 hypothetical protein SAMN05421630_1086 [Prauserella marina]